MYSSVKLSLVYFVIIFGLFDVYKATDEVNDYIRLRIYGDSFDKFDTFDYKDGLQVFKSSYFDANKPTAIYLHGWVYGFDQYSANVVLPALIKLGKYNNMAYDYSSLVKRKLTPSQQQNTTQQQSFKMDSDVFQSISGLFQTYDFVVAYWSSADNVSLIGNAIGKQLSDFAGNLDPKKLHLLGFSLGSHIAGIASKTFSLLNNQSKIFRITGFDPAGPLFENPFPKPRLSSTDATVVVAIHTNTYLYGNKEELGTVDFFADLGGPFQPACPSNLTFFERIVCSHQMSFIYYVEALFNPNNFVAKQCTNLFYEIAGFCKFQHEGSNLLSLGEDIPEGTNGSYYFKVNENPPYGKGYDGVLSMK